MEIMIELERALELVKDLVRPTQTETVSLDEAFGRVLAEDVYSPTAVPPFWRSPLDGYAYLASSTDQTPLRLKIICEIPAGKWPKQEIRLGEAAKIYTGAPIPPGANCVVRIEDTELISDQEVLIHNPVPPNSNQVPKGDEIKEGENLLLKGTLLTPPAVGLMAASGLDNAKIFRRPRVGLISTGSELMEAGKEPVLGKIYNSNSYTLRGLIRGEGCDVKIIPFVPDSLPETLEALKELNDTDVIISTGGASVGDYDLIREAMENYGCEMLFWKINLKPGTPVSVGIKEGQLFFALSGNPAAAMVSFELLVSPILRKLAGRITWQREEFTVRMAQGFDKGGRQRRFLRAKAIVREGELWADLATSQGSGILRSMIGSELLVDVPADHGPVKEGEKLKARWI